MAGRRISGIFVPIQLDTSNVQRDMEGLNKSLGTVINSIQKKFEGSLPTFIAAFTKRQDLSAHELDEVQQMIDRIRRGETQ